MSFCWCPTGSFYNYVTYVFFLISVVCLYLGLSRGKKGGLLFAAGVALGCNVLSRFSNLPEAAMIVGVWAYGIICWLEEQKSIVQDCVDVAGNAETENKEARKKAAGRRLRKKLLQDTGMCLAGYLTALLVLFGYIQIRYGMDEYVKRHSATVFHDGGGNGLYGCIHDHGHVRLVFSESVLGDPDVRVLCSGDCHCGSIGTHRLLREKRYSKKGAADPGMGGKYRTGGCDGVLAVPPGLLCQRIYELRRHYLARCNVFNADAPGDAVADIHAFRTGGGKAAQRTDLPDRTDHFSWK